MTQFQIVNDKPYLNSIETEVDTIALDKIGDRLASVNEQIEAKKRGLNTLVKQRDELIVYAYNNGWSAIQLGITLGLTRQRIYDVLNLAKLEEE